MKPDDIVLATTAITCSIMVAVLCLFIITLGIKDMVDMLQKISNELEKRNRKQ